MKWFWD